MTREEKVGEQLKVLVLNFAKGYVKDGDMDKEVEAMKWAESFIDKYTAEKVLEARIDEAEHFIADNDGNEYYQTPYPQDDITIDQHLSDIQAELSKLKDKE